MKRAIFFPLITLAMMSVGCQTDDTAIAPEVSYDKISLFATSPGGDSTKVGFEDQTLTDQKIVLTWENDGTESDSFTIYDNNGVRVGDFKYAGVDGAQSGTFTQVGEFSMTDGVEYTAVIPAGEYATLAEHDAAQTTAQQTISDIDDISYLDGAIKLKGSFVYDEDGENNIAFAHELSFARLVVTMPESVYAASIKMTDCGVDYLLSLPEGGAGGTFTTFVVVDPVASTDSRNIDFVVTDTAAEIYDITKSGTTQNFEAGRYYTINLTVDAKEPTIVDYYTDGIEINGVTYIAGEGVTLLTESGTISSTSGGIIFLDPKDEDQVFTLNTATYTNLVVIGRYPTSKPKVVCGGSQYFGVGESIVYKNIDLTAYSSGNTFVFASSNAGTLTNWIVEDCDITTASDKPLSYFNNGDGSIKNIKFDGNKIALDISADNKNVNVLSFNAVDPSIFEDISFTNNTIYTPSEYYANGAIFTIAPTTTSNLTLSATNNTIVDFIATTATFNIPNAASVSFDKNIFWGDSDIAVNTNLLRFTQTDASATVDFGDNLAYGLGSGNYWRQYTSTTTYPTTGNSSSFSKSASDPFSTFDKATGTFVPTAENSAYGAQ